MQINSEEQNNEFVLKELSPKDVVKRKTTTTPSAGDSLTVAKKGEIIERIKSEYESQQPQTGTW